MGIEGGFTYFRCTTRAKEGGIYRVHEEGFSLGRDFFIWITWKRKIVFKLDNTFFLFIVEDRAIYIILERDRLTSLIIISLI